MTIYPSSIDSSLQLPTVAGVSSEATAINALQSAVIAIETELGVNPRGIYSDVNTRLSIIEARVGPGPVITGGPIDINDAILSGTLSILKGGTGLNSIGVANTLMISNGVALFYDFITNDNIDPAASIDGTKIVPDFGTQDITTTGDIYITSVIFGGSGPSITVGAGVPSSSQPNGSLYLRTDGTSSTGVYTRQSGAWGVVGAGITATAGGSDTQVQFNDGGLVNGDAGFAYNKTTNVLSVSDAIAIGSTLSAVATTAELRFPNLFGITQRNPGDTGDIGVLQSYDAGGGITELSLGTYDDGSPAKSFERTSICASEFAYFWINNAASVMSVGRTLDHNAYATFINGEASLALIASTTSFDSPHLGGGEGVLYMGNAVTVPTTNPAVGIVAYVESDILKYRQPDGTVIVLDGSGGGGGSPGGSADEIQVNDGAGGFAAATNVKAGVDFGQSYISVGAVPANFGAIRLPADEYIYSRDGNPGSSNVQMLGLNSSTSEVEISTSGYDIRFFPGNARTIYYQSSVHQFYGGNGTTDLLYIDDSREGTSGINIWSTNQDTKGTERSRAPQNTQTTDATPLSVGSFTLPANSTSCVVSWLVGCIKDDATAAGGYSVAAVFLQDSGGTVTLVGSPVVTTIGETLSGCDATAITDGTNISLEITGVAATNITWSWIRTSLEVIP